MSCPEMTSCASHGDRQDYAAFDFDSLMLYSSP